MAGRSRRARPTGTAEIELPCFYLYMDENVEGKGRGVRAKRDLLPGQFICQYMGELITASEAEKRENAIPSVFRYFFQYNGVSWCIDATEEPNHENQDEKFGRLINHGDKKQCNAKVKVIKGDKPTLCKKIN